MSFIYEITLKGTPDAQKAATDWFAASPRAAFAAVPGLVSLDTYVSAEQAVADPYNNDGRGPLLIVVLEFGSRAALAGAIPQIVASVGELPKGVTATGSAMERLYYPVAGETAPASLMAPLSYVVRYHRPADDEDAFRENYIATHPVTQADLPMIRSVMCYLPLDDLNHPALPGADYMVGNEVVFDSIADLNTSMKSPVREELRKHYREFPRFTGAVTHFPMDRVRHAG